MPSLAQRIKAFLNPYPALPSKSYSSGSSLFSWGYTGANHDLRADEYGAAQAVAIVTEVQRAVQFWQQWLSGLTWHLYDGATDEILVSSTDRKPKAGNGAMWFRAVKRFPESWKHDFFESIAFSDWVWGETYIGKLRNQVQVADFMWLNPLGTEPDIMQGRIRGYRYSGDEGYYLLDVNEVAYRIAQRNPLDDWRGLSPVLNAIDKINLTENVHRSLNAYYRRHMQLGGVVSPKGDMDIIGTTMQKLEEKMTRNHQGAVNAFGWFFNEAPVEIQQFQPLDIEKNYTIVEPLRKQIAHAMGVPPVLSGDPTEVNYDNADKVMRNWWQTDGIPYARKVANFVNRQLLPDVEPNTDIYFGFDFTDFEIETPDVVTADFNAGYIDYTVSQSKRGHEVDEGLKGIYMVNGMPMHRDIIIKIANQIPPEYQQPAPLPPATGGTPDAPALPQAGTPDSALPLVTDDSEDTDTVQETKAAFLAADDHVHIEGHTLAIETWDYAPDKARKELIAWQKHVKSGSKRPFEPLYTRGDIADSVVARIAENAEITAVFDTAFALLPQGIETLKTAFISVFEALENDDSDTATKSLQSIRLDFEGRFEDVLRDIRSGNIDNRRRAGNILRQMIRTFGYRAYVQGLADGGVEDAPSEDDEAAIASLRSEQSSYISNLTSVLITGDGVTDTQAAGKAEMWWRKTMQPFYYAGLESAAKNAMMEFAGDDGQESCPTCKRLKGQRHRLKDWKRKQLRPQVDTANFICGGWQCEHKLIPVAGKARGKF